MCTISEYMTKTTVVGAPISDKPGNDGKRRNIKGYGEFVREKAKHL